MFWNCLRVGLRTGLLIAAVVGGGLGASAGRATAPLVMPKTVPKAVVQRIAELERKMDAIQADKAYSSLFLSEDGPVIRVQAHFFRAKKSLHDVVVATEGGRGIDIEAVDNFHNSIVEYLMNLEEMPPNHNFGATKAPNARTKKRLIKDVEAVRTGANKTPGFEDAAHCAPSKDATAEDAVRFAKRSLTEVYYRLDSRTLTYVTSQGTRASKDLRASLDEVWASLDALLDVNGGRVAQVGPDGEVLANQLQRFEAAMREARVQAEFYRRNYLPNAWRDAHRRRAEGIEELLAEGGFQRRFVAVKSMREVPDVQE